MYRNPLMNRLLFFLLLLPAMAHAQSPDDSIAKKYWSDPRYKAANTAAKISTLTADEKLVYYYLNLARMNPPLFADTYLKRRSGERDYMDEAEGSLYDELKAMKPMPVLQYDSAEYRTAKCLAEELVRENRFSHERHTCTDNNGSECCSAGVGKPLGIILLLLIDDGVSSYGHRRICLNAYVTKLGVSLHDKHPTWGTVGVLDFN